MDAECGEHSDRTGLVIGVVGVVGLFLLIAISLFVLYYLKKKKKGRLNTGKICIYTIKSSCFER